jgi:S-adenosylmethionine/arginine decarboxylase-like enzyme
MAQAPGGRSMSIPLVGPAPAYVHLIADFVGVAEAQLQDASLLTGLIIAAASAVGLTPLGSPLVHVLPQGGVSGFLLMQGCHLAVHTTPGRRCLLLDVLVPRTHDAAKALAVFARRLSATQILTDQRPRG